MEEPHAHGVQQRSLERAQNRTDEIGSRSCAKPLGASKLKGPFNDVQDSPLHRLASHR
jgi:hypothetical protein